jgi:hypothetical protein
MVQTGEEEHLKHAPLKALRFRADCHKFNKFRKANIERGKKESKKEIYVKLTYQLP